MKKKKFLTNFLLGTRGLWDSFYSATSYSNLQKQKDKKEWPNEWKNVEYKNYLESKRFFTKEILNKTDIEKQIFIRRSSRKFNNFPISKKELLRLLYISSGISFMEGEDINQAKRTYPSPGNLYSLDIYPVIIHAQDVPLGIYHYNVLNNCLELIREGGFAEKLIKATPQEWIGNASVVFIVTTTINRLYPKYKDRSFRFVFLEAGHLGQNFYLESHELGFLSCAIGSFIDDKFIDLLDLKNANEFPIYAIAIGK